MDEQGAKIGVIVREYLREALARDLSLRSGLHGAALYANALKEPTHPDPLDADLEAIQEALGEARLALAQRDTNSVGREVTDLIARYGLPKEARGPLALGILAAKVKALEGAQKRTLGDADAIFSDVERVQALAPIQPLAPPPPPQVPPKLCISTLIEEALKVREERDGVLLHTVKQEHASLRLFLEIAGDRPPADYTRKDVTGFLDTLRRMPSSYGKSAADKALSVADLIARADAQGAERLKDKTCKRHLSALSQFFEFCVDHSHLTHTARADLVEGHSFRSTKAREQRDQWQPAELTALFSSLIWTGYAPPRRTEPGTTITRDAHFWLPLLALFQGGRLEEFADLRRSDVATVDGIPVIHFTDTKRRLKNKNANRTVPMHPEIIRLGFLPYVQAMAAGPDDPLFPDLETQGVNKKRGPRFTRDFRYYRERIGVYREGVGMHAFRHTANTRLRDAIADWQQERHVAHLLGHSQGGGEGRERYDKGPKLKALRDTLGLLVYPEVNLKHLYQG